MIKQGEALILLGRLFSKQDDQSELEVTDLSEFGFYISLQLHKREYHRAEATCHDGYFSFVIDSSTTATLDPFIYQMEVGMTINGGNVVCRQEIPIEIKRSALGRALSPSNNSPASYPTTNSSSNSSSTERVEYRIELTQSGNEISCSSWSDENLINLYLGYVIKGEKGDDGYTPIKGIDYYTDVNITQERGDSTDKVMSQAASTDSFIATNSSTLEDILAYGIQFDTSNSSPTCTRIGSASLHRSLPIQSMMRGCLLNDDGVVMEYLPEDDWSSATRDGSIGQVMVEFPKYYRKFVTNGTIRQVWMSETPIEGYHEVPKAYLSAYEASLQRSSLKLSSVVNYETDYRGGSFTTDYSERDDTPRTHLGRPITQISRTDLRTYARNRKSSTTEWNINTYDLVKNIYWLFVVEYATLNSQLDVNNTLSSDGYKQGGLGCGATSMNDPASAWVSYNSAQPFIPCGCTDQLGNNSGEATYYLFDESGDAFSSISSIQVSRYRGLENLFGHLKIWTDGIIVSNSGTSADNESKVYITSDPNLFNDTSIDEYEYLGLQARYNGLGYITNIIFGEWGDIIADSAGTGSSSTYFCDSQYMSTSASYLTAVSVGGNATYNLDAGLAQIDSYFVASQASSSIGTRLSFIPQQ